MASVFPLKVLWASHFGNGREDIVKPVNENGNDLEIGPSGNRRHHWHRANMRKARLPGYKGLDNGRRATNENVLYFKPMFSEDPGIDSDLYVV